MASLTDRLNDKCNKSLCSHLWHKLANFDPVRDYLFYWYTNIWFNSSTIKMVEEKFTFTLLKFKYIYAVACKWQGFWGMIGNLKMSIGKIIRILLVFFKARAEDVFRSSFLILRIKIRLERHKNLCTPLYVWMCTHAVYIYN